MLAPSVALRAALCLAALTQMCDSVQNSTVGPCQGTDGADGSDETGTEYSLEDATTQVVRGNSSSQINILPGSCILPQQPEYGSYTSPVCEHGSTPCKEIPGSPVSENWLLLFKCNDDYFITGTCFEARFFLFCVNGNWSDKIPVCKTLTQMCDSLRNSTVAPCQGTDGADGSDEMVTKCSFEDTITQVVRGESSLQSSISLEYCILPEQPESGSYISPVWEHESTAWKNIPGKTVPKNWFLSFKCNDGYAIEGTRSIEASVLLYCKNGNWSDKIPVCKRVCSPLISSSVEVTCKYQGFIIDCSKSMRPGTLARGICKPSYVEIHPPLYRELVCKDNGSWSNELFDCHPVCGKRNFKNANATLITNGTPTKHSEFPWHAGLYMKNETNHWEQKCGGSLISPHIVLTVAHCVFLENTKNVISPTDIKVGLGKYYREWTHVEKNALKSDVREISIPTGYLGQATSFAQDIALLDLTHSVQITANFMPVCVDWDLQLTITPGTTGTLPFWGGTENTTPSDVLLHTELPYEYAHCILGVPPYIQYYLINDKFCVDVSKGSLHLQGNTGGGLTFLRNDLHYVFGIASTILLGDKVFLTFTNVSNADLHAWLIFTKRRFDELHSET